jgi:hypothetical protein
MKRTIKPPAGGDVWKLQKNPCWAGDLMRGARISQSSVTVDPADGQDSAAAKVLRVRLRIHFNPHFPDEEQIRRGMSAIQLL